MTTVASFPKNRPFLQIYTAAASPGIQAGPGAWIDVDTIYDPGKGRYSISQWAIEFNSPALVVPEMIGDGNTTQVGLYGRDDANRQFLLGILGIGQGNRLLQIPMFGNGTGWSQILNVVGVYKSLTIGAITGGPIALTAAITVDIRPIRNYKI